MLSKCANPSCAAPFLYFHSGKLFRVERRRPVPQVEPSMSDPKPVRSIEYYWLCETCAGRLTLARGEEGIVVKSLEMGRFDVAS
jgi:hypothetical protein